MLSFFFDCKDGPVCIFKRKYSDLRANMESLSDCQKIARILSSHIGHTAYLPLAPKQFVVVKDRHMVKMNGIDCHHSTFTQTSEGTYHDLSTGSKRDCTVERHGRPLIFFADPCGTERGSHVSMRFASGHNIDFAFPGLQNGNR